MLLLDLLFVFMFYGGMNEEQEGEECEMTGLTLDFFGWNNRYTSISTQVGGWMIREVKLG